MTLRGLRLAPSGPHPLQAPLGGRSLPARQPWGQLLCLPLSSWAGPGVSRRASELLRALLQTRPLGSEGRGMKRGRDGPGVGSPGPGRDVPAAANEPAVCCSQMFTRPLRRPAVPPPAAGRGGILPEHTQWAAAPRLPKHQRVCGPRAQGGRRGGDGAGRSCPHEGLRTLSCRGRYDASVCECV